jgi:transposase-like protein
MDMKRSRFSEEQIIAVLKEQEAGMATADVCRRHGISSATFYKWTPRRTWCFRPDGGAKGLIGALGV